MIWLYGCIDANEAATFTILLWRKFSCLFAYGTCPFILAFKREGRSLICKQTYRKQKEKWMHVQVLWGKYWICSKNPAPLLIHLPKTVKMNPFFRKMVWCCKSLSEFLKYKLFSQKVSCTVRNRYILAREKQKSLCNVCHIRKY